MPLEHGTIQQDRLTALLMKENLIQIELGGSKIAQCEYIGKVCGRGWKDVK